MSSCVCVHTYIPNLVRPEFKGPKERYKEITVRMLMNHTSGIMGSSTTNGMLYEDNDTRYHDELLQSLAEQRLKADPGAYAAYCNDGFGLLEIIVENVIQSILISILSMK